MPDTLESRSTKPLHESSVALGQAMAAATTGKDAAYILRREIDAMSDKLMNTLPLRYHSVATHLLQLMRVAPSYLEAARGVRSFAATGLTPVRPHYPYIRLQGMQIYPPWIVLVLLLIVLFAALATSWLAGIAFALALIYVALELAPRFTRADTFGVSPPLHTDARDELEIDGTKIIDVLRNMEETVDNALEEVKRLPDQTVNRPSLKLESDMLEFLQRLLSDYQHDNLESVHEFRKVARRLLKHRGLRAITYTDLEDKDQVDEYFHTIVNRTMTTITTKLPAIIAEDGVVLLEGSIIFPE